MKTSVRESDQKGEQESTARVVNPSVTCGTQSCSSYAAGSNQKRLAVLLQRKQARQQQQSGSSFIQRLEQDADRFADAALSGQPFSVVGMQPPCQCGGTCPKCKGTRGVLTKKSNGNNSPPNIPNSRISPFKGKPIGSGARQKLEQISGQSLSDVRVHTDSQANQAAQQQGALAYTQGNQIVFGQGQYRPGEREGFRLLAHEVGHVLQQRALGRGLLQKQEGAIENADALGPCEILVGNLTNLQLLQQLNRARVYLTRTTRGEDQFYDYANLFRRLAAERRRRISSGNAWLAEAGLIEVPGVLYTLSAGEGTSVNIIRADSSQISGARGGASSTTPIITRAQLGRFFSRHRVSVIDVDRAVNEIARGQPGASTMLNLNPREKFRRVYEYIQSPANSLFGPLQNNTNPYNNLFAPNSPFGSYGRNPSAYPFLFGQRQNPVTPFVPPWLANRRDTGRTERYTPNASELVNNLRNRPGSFTADGRERLYFDTPAQTPGQQTTPANPQPIIYLDPNAATIGQHGMGFNPYPLSSLGHTAAPGALIPNNSTGILWQGSHVTDLVTLNGQTMYGGYRAGFPRHAVSTAERTPFIRRLIPGRGAATASLNRGTPGTYANDAFFPLTGNAIVIYRANGTPASAQEVAALMRDAHAQMRGQYRFSTPPRSNPAFNRAFPNQPAGFTPPDARNCINLPADIHNTAMGGGQRLVIPQADGGVIDLSLPQNASAQNMRTFTELPDSFFAERGLVKVNMTARAWGNVGMGAGLGGVISLASDFYQGTTTDQNPRYFVNAGINTVAGGGSVILENQVTNSMMLRGGSPWASRLAGGSAAAVVFAPVVTAATMYFDDNEYTTIDYVARSTRSGTSALGAALASGGSVAILGSFFPGVGNGVGFIVGFGGGLIGYFVTDWAVGDEVEQGVRNLMGEQGCTGGIGPGR